ncbi:hypothetical protein ACOME3_008902 [Neoechinorhynchus agilis]
MINCQGCHNAGSEYQSMSILRCEHLNNSLPMFHEAIIHLYNISNLNAVLPEFAIPHVLGFRLENSGSVSMDAIANAFPSVQLIELQYIQYIDLGIRAFSTLTDLRTLRLSESKVSSKYPRTFYEHSSLIELSLWDIIIVAISKHNVDALPDFVLLVSLQLIKLSGRIFEIPPSLIKLMKIDNALLKVVIESNKLKRVPRDIFAIKSFKQLVIYSTSFDCSCSNDWFKVIAKHSLLPNWKELVQASLANDFLVDLPSNLSVTVGGYCDKERRRSRLLDQQSVLFLNSPICCHKGYYTCSNNSRCIQKGPNSHCLCNTDCFLNVFGLCEKH